MRACKKKKVVPSFIKIKTAVQNPRAAKAVQFAQSKWLNLEIKDKFKQMSDIELELYNLHLEITKNMNENLFDEWISFSEKVNLTAKDDAKKKRLRQSKKLNKLIEVKNTNGKCFEPEIIPDFVINKSSVDFNEEELNLLNLGLKYTPKPLKTPFVDLAVDIETILKYKLPSVQEELRTTTNNVFDCALSTDRQSDTKTINEHKLIKSLREKDCVYVKADKGNKIVILDSVDYDRRVLDLIDECSYKEVKKSPLLKMVRESDAIRKEISKVFGKRLLRTLIVPNPMLAKIYALPKIHKVGDKMRPIVSNINTPIYKMAKWLVREIKNLPPWPSQSVKNSFDFVTKIKNVVLNDDEIMISFDVESLFPSIPIKEALGDFRDFLETTNLKEEEKQVYRMVAKTCMDHNYFEFRDKFYKVEKGTNMGNPISPLISEVFMSAFETKLKNENLLPRLWLRYVDDIFAIVKCDEVENVLNILNSRFDSINFTEEKERNGKLAFLDLELKRINNKIEIGVYHKETSTKRVIPNISHCAIQHKLAGFHSHIHRLCRLPLSIENYKKEYDYIQEIAKINGYSSELVDNIVYKHSEKVRRSNLSTFFATNEKLNLKRVSISFVPRITNKLKSKFKEFGMQFVYRNESKLVNLLGTTKDKTPQLNKSGIYSVECGDCKRSYHGQTKRAVTVRVGEHFKCIRNNMPSRSAVALHALVNEHTNVSIENAKLEKQVNDERRLDAYEYYYIKRDPSALNLDEGNITSSLIDRLI